MKKIKFIFYLFLICNQLYSYDGTNIEKLLNQKEWIKAELELKKAIKDSPNTEWLYSSLLYVFNSQSKDTEAIDFGRKALSIFPNSKPIKESLSLSLSIQCSKLLSTQETLVQALELCKESYELTQSEVSTIWYGTVLKQNKYFQKSIEVLEEGKSKFPTNDQIQNNLAYCYFEYGMEFLNRKQFIEAEKYLSSAYSILEKDFILYQLAVAYREQKKYTLALELLEKGQIKFPENKFIMETYPYTRFLRFKEMLITELPPFNNIKSEISKTISLLDKKKNFRNQYYYQNIIVKGINHISDVKYHEDTYQKLIQLFPNDPDAYDNFGFSYYTIKSKKENFVTKEDRERAIKLRRKAIELYEKEFPNRKSLTQISHPLQGKYFVLSEFGGTAMTHNGLAKYCYDFMAVNEKGEFIKENTSGKSNLDYLNFDQSLLAIDDGEVIDLLNTEPDNEPGQIAYNGNYITIQHKGYSSFYAHTKQYSIPFSIGAKIKRGDVIGRSGNSGMSRESHLHFCLNDENWVSLPFLFKAQRKWKNQTMILNDRPLKEGEIVEFVKE
ncbi:MAG: peptidoglycan DD-metalloendopeptidase family protein [Leptospira sp.]|nr:peptidoglycan DD-metalloendopeptidase family protein [Leptospira sp.]